MELIDNHLDCDPIAGPYEYLKAPTEIQLIKGGRYVGLAKRCGITSPWYVDRATYYLSRDGIGAGVYVFDKGRLWPSEWWRQDSANLNADSAVKPVKVRKRSDAARTPRVTVTAAA